MQRRRPQGLGLHFPGAVDAGLQVPDALPVDVEAYDLETGCREAGGDGQADIAEPDDRDDSLLGHTIFIVGPNWRPAGICRAVGLAHGRSPVKDVLCRNTFPGVVLSQ